ncbi:MAG: hypothetical protein JWN16_2034 [Alphaproteobacteria bacterium]|nr:hypothetical protein [Alphaproteobacteria bacterium]
MGLCGSSSDFYLRASATSRIAHPSVSASVSASHASASKAADGGTPFELLLASVSPKAAKPSQGSAKDDAGHSDKNDKPADTVSEAGSTHDTATPAKDAKPATDKADAKDDKDDKADATADTSGAPAPDGAPAPQVAMMQPPTPQTAAQTAGTDTEESIGDVAAAAGPKTAAPQGVAPGEDGPANGLAAAKAAAPGQPDADTKADAPSKGGARKTAAADAKADASDDLKADAAKAAAPQVASEAPAKPASQTAAQADTNVTIASPQAATPASAAASLTQHVQVSAEQPLPNMPALAVQIAVRSQSGARQFDIRLDPPELGHVEVRLSIDATGKASAHLSADRPQTLDLLQKDSTSLTRALREAGLDVSQDGLNFSLRQQGQQAGQDSGNAPAFSRRGALSLSATTSIDATTTSATWRSPADGRLDIRV